MSKYKKRKKRHVLRNALIILIILFALALIFANPKDTEAPVKPPSADSPAFEVYFLDVGQGDCALILCDGKTMLIDGGDSHQSSKLYSFLESHGIKHLDYIVASHPDADHVGGLSGALNYATAGTALCTVTEHDTKAFCDFVRYLKKQGVSITVPDAGSTYSLGSAAFTIVGPEKGTRFSDNTSLIIRVSYGETSFLFTGDAEYEDEQAAIASGEELKSTVLKVGHHGSSSSSSYDFVRAVSPEYAVISVAADNTYYHPTQKTLNRLRDVGAAVYRTDLGGDIHCVSDGKTVFFETSRTSDVDPFTPGPLLT